MKGLNELEILIACTMVHSTNVVIYSRLVHFNLYSGKKNWSAGNPQTSPQFITLALTNLDLYGTTPVSLGIFKQTTYM